MAGSSLVVDFSSSLLKEAAVLFGITLGFHQEMEESFRRRRKEMKFTVKYAVKYSLLSQLAQLLSHTSNIGAL